MKNKEFQQLRAVVFARTALLILAAVAVVWFLHSFAARGRFTEWSVQALQTVLRMERGEALRLHQRIFRRHMDLWIWLALLTAAGALFRVHLGWITDYFAEIAQGLDALTEEGAGEVSLPPELHSIERRMNAVKRAMERQKSEMQSAERRKNDLVMYLAHDLKTPLASVVSYLGLLRDEARLSGELRERYLAVSLEKAERLEDLIEEFLEIAKFDRTDLTLQYERVDLTRLLEQLAFEFQPLLREKRLHCRLSAPDGLTLDCDAGKMQRVFDNLLRNAVAYSDSGTEIQIGAAAEGGRLTVCISNWGATIPPEKLGLIFEQFYRLDAGRGAGGTGLGLAIAKRIVTLHQGTIAAESGDGRTTFSVELPVSSENCKDFRRKTDGFRVEERINAPPDSGTI